MMGHNGTFLGVGRDNTANNNPAISTETTDIYSRKKLSCVMLRHIACNVVTCTNQVLKRDLSNNLHMLVGLRDQSIVVQLMSRNFVGGLTTYNSTDNKLI